MKKECADCEYWVAEDDDYGHCHRRAPSALHMGMWQGAIEALTGKPWETDRAEDQLQRMAYWPVTASHEWCGEWKLRDDS